MDRKAAKNVDSLYRNVKQLPLLGCLGVLIPIIGIMLLPIAIAYTYLRSQLIRAIDGGKITVEEHDLSPAKEGELSTKAKIEFIRAASFAVPIVVGSLWLAVVGLLVMMATASR